MHLELLERWQGRPLWAPLLYRFASTAILSLSLLFVPFTATADGWQVGLHELEQLVESTGGASDRTRRHLLVQKLHSLSNEEDMHPESVEALQDAFEAVDFVSYYTGDEWSAQQSLRLYLELKDRGVATSQQALVVYGILTKARLLEEAEELRRQELLSVAPLTYRDIATPTNNSDSTFFAWDRAGGALERIATNLVSSDAIVVISHPNCHFSEAAMEAVSTNPRLAEIFGRHAIWLMPPARELNPERLAAWGARYPGQQVAEAYRKDEWALIDDWETPVFYFFKDGSLVYSFAGWPLNDGRYQELEAGLQAQRAKAEVSN